MDTIREDTFEGYQAKSGATTTKSLRRANRLLGGFRKREVKTHLVEAKDFNDVEKSKTFYQSSKKTSKLQVCVEAERSSENGKSSSPPSNASISSRNKDKPRNRLNHTLMVRGKRRSCVGGDSIPFIGINDQSRELERKVDFFYSNYNHEVLVGSHMDFDDSTGDDESIHKWKVVTDLICLKDKHHMRDILKKINNRLYTDPQAVAKWVFRKKKSPINRGINKLRTYVNEHVNNKKEGDNQRSKKNIPTTGNMNKDSSRIPFISLTQVPDMDHSGKLILLSPKIKEPKKLDMKGLNKSNICKPTKVKRRKRSIVKQTEIPKNRQSFSLLVEDTYRRQSTGILRKGRIGQLNDKKQLRKIGSSFDALKSNLQRVHTLKSKHTKLQPNDVNNKEVEGSKTQKHKGLDTKELIEKNLKSKIRENTYYNKSYRPKSSRAHKQWRKYRVGKSGDKKMQSTGVSSLLSRINKCVDQPVFSPQPHRDRASRSKTKHQDFSDVYKSQLVKQYQTYIV